MIPALLLAVAVVGQPQQFVTAIKRPTPRDAVHYATQDCLAIGNPDTQKFTRYIWWPQPSKVHTAETLFVLNTAVSQNEVRYRPAVLYGGALIRYDLRMLAPRSTDLNRIRDIIEELSGVNRYFNTIRVVSQSETKVRVNVKPYRARDGKTYNYKFETRPADPSKKVDLIEPSIHTGLDRYLLLRTLTQSANPVMRGEQFQQIALMPSSLGGRYYQFMGFEQTSGGVTAYDKFAARFGAPVNSLNSQNRVAIQESGVTKKPRQGHFFIANLGRPVNGSLFSTTWDTGREDVEAENDPIRNLLNFQARASETIATRPNGMLAYFLSLANGDRADTVADSIAKDSEAHPKSEGRLIVGISCIRCHGPNTGWQSVQNDALHLLRGALNVYDDESSKTSYIETLETLNGQYSGRISEPIRIARNQHEFAVFSLTGMTVKDVAAAVSDTYGTYRYERITPKVAVLEMGYEVKTEVEAVKLFNAIVTLLPRNSRGIIPEDPIIGRLRAWSPQYPTFINRVQWERIYSDVMIRALTKQVIDAGGKLPHHQPDQEGKTK
jgi:hypothetical protein